MPELAVLHHDAVLSAVSPAAAIDAVREGFLAHHRGEWSMPAKVYLDSPPFGDFRAMPARGGGLALLKWVTSFPGNPARGLRTGAVAAVAADALAADGGRSAGIVGCGLHGAWTARCLAAAGYADGVCHDPRTEAAAALAAELGGWVVGDLPAALACDVVCAVTPGATVVLERGHLRPGQHLNMPR